MPATPSSVAGDWRYGAYHSGADHRAAKIPLSSGSPGPSPRSSNPARDQHAQRPGATAPAPFSGCGSKPRLQSILDYRRGTRKALLRVSGSAAAAPRAQPVIPARSTMLRRRPAHRWRGSRLIAMIGGERSDCNAGAAGGLLPRISRQLLIGLIDPAGVADLEQGAAPPRSARDQIISHACRFEPQDSVRAFGETKNGLGRVAVDGYRDHAGYLVQEKVLELSRLCLAPLTLLPVADADRSRRFAQ